MDFCRCGHARYLHYRPGADCALCDCPRFRKARKAKVSA